MTKSRVRCSLQTAIAALAAALALATPVSTAEAQQKAADRSRAVSILFVGNSFLHGEYQPVRSYNTASVIDENANQAPGSPRSEGSGGPYGGIPAIFKKLTEGVGLDYDVHSELVSGRTFEFHYTNALSVIAQPKWDVIVMHDHSMGPLPVARGGKPDVFTKYADLLEQAIHRENQSADIYLYETWARADLTYPEKKPYSGEPIQSMARDLHDSYSGELARNRRFKDVIHVGDAWMLAIRDGVAGSDPTHPEQSKINLWGPDSYHPSIYGAYLNALVVLHRVTGKDPRTLGAAEKAASDLGISPEMAVKLQQLAYAIGSK